MKVVFELRTKDVELAKKFLQVLSKKDTFAFSPGNLLSNIFTV